MERERERKNKRNAKFSNTKKITGEKEPKGKEHLVDGEAN